MYTYEQRIMAVKLYQKYGRRVASVIRELGFPNRHMLVKWVKEYESTGDLGISVCICGFLSLTNLI